MLLLMHISCIANKTIKILLFILEPNMPLKFSYIQMFSFKKLRTTKGSVNNWKEFGLAKS